MTLKHIFLLVLIGSLSACADDVDPPDTRPDMGDEDIGVVDMPEEDMTDPDMTEPDMTEPDMTEPDMTEPDMTDMGDDMAPDQGQPDTPEDFDPLQICLSDCNYSGPHWCEVDCDYDGLSNCEEAQLGTDSCQTDTDGDGLNDLAELQVGSDPMVADSDGDGLNDADEITFGFNPTNPSTYNDQILDGDRWIVSACDTLEGETLNYEVSSAGDWLVAFPTVFGNYVELGISTATPQNAQAASVFEDPANEVAGTLFSMRPAANQTTPEDVQAFFRSRVAATGSIVQDSTGGGFTTHDFETAAIARFLIRTPQQSSIRQVRDALLFNLAPFEAADVTGLPVSSGTTYRDFRVYISVTYRESDQNGDRLVVAAALAPAQKFDANEKVSFRMDDLTNTTNVASSQDDHFGRCNAFRAGEGNPEADFYWVLDQSGSMSDDYVRVRNVANNFFANLTNTALDYRLAVTTMDRDYDGRPVGNVPWYTDQPTFLAGINEVETGPYNGGAEYGLNSARDGIQWMRSSSAPQISRVRPDAQLITIFVSDEEDNDFQYENLSDPSVANFLEQYVQFFVANTIAFAIVTIDPGDRYEDGEAYRRVALATGGSVAELTANDIQETIDEIIYAATGLASAYVLPSVPISSSLRVYKDNVWVPRSRENGFDYFANSNSIAFFGTYRPEPADPTQGRYGDDIAVGYETFLDLTKD